MKSLTIHAIIRVMAKKLRKTRASKKRDKGKKRVGRARPASSRAVAKKKWSSWSISFRGLDIKSTAAMIGAQLERAGHMVVLVGRACAAIYAGRSIKPKALEFVIEDFAVNSVNKAMEEIGFGAIGQRTFTRDGCPFEVVLNPMPITVGDDIAHKVRIIKTPKGPLRLLTATDCVRQRLSNYYRFGEPHALIEAVRVARRQRVDMDLIRRWSDWEWAMDKFEEFESELRSRTKA